MIMRRVGRADDVIVMANGEKTVPGPIESAICAHPLIQGAVAFGRGREQIGVLVEPNTVALQCMDVEQLKEEIWYVRPNLINEHTDTVA
jgi:long-subunit acyl-CoA synthetase (AMP-forming)